MVLAFFKGNSGEGNFDSIVAKAVGMLGDARHSFDLATLALLTGTGADTIAADVRETDERINAAEQELRSELIVHVSVQGNADIGSVLAFTLLLKKIERIGDQATNILDLSENNVSLAEHPEVDALLEGRQVVSLLFAEGAELLNDSDPDEAAVDAYAVRATAIADDYQEKIAGFMTSERPAREVVPLAIYYRYLRRIVANLIGVVRVSSDPFPQMDYLEGGTVDTYD